MTEGRLRRGRGQQKSGPPRGWGDCDGATGRQPTWQGWRETSLLAQREPRERSQGAAALKVKGEVLPANTVKGEM